MSSSFIHQGSISWHFFLLGTVFGNWAAIIPKVKDMHKINNGELGGILVGVVFGAICVIPIVTKLIEKYGSAVTVRIASVILIISYPIIGINDNIGILVFGMVMLGFCAGFMDISMNGQAVLYEKSTGNHHLGFFTSIFAIGNLVGALLGGAMIGPFNLSVLKQCLILSGGLAVPSLFFTINLFPYSEEIEITNNTPLTTADHRTEQPQTAFTTDLSKPILDSSGPSSPSPTSSPLSQTLIVISALSFLAYFGEGSVGDWSAIYLSNHDASPFLSSLGVAIFQFFIAIGRFYSDYLVKSIGRIALLKLSGVLATIGLLIVAFAPFAITLFSSFNLYFISSIIGFSLSGIGLSVVYPTCISIAGNCIEGMSSADAIAFVSSIGYIGVMIGPPLLGGISLLVSLQYSFLVDALLLGCMTILAFYL